MIIKARSLLPPFANVIPRELKASAVRMNDYNLLETVGKNGKHSFALAYRWIPWQPSPKWKHGNGVNTELTHKKFTTTSHRKLHDQQVSKQQQQHYSLRDQEQQPRKRTLTHKNTGNKSRKQGTKSLERNQQNKKKLTQKRRRKSRQEESLG